MIKGGTAYYIKGLNTEYTRHHEIKLRDTFHWKSINRHSCFKLEQ